MRGVRPRSTDSGYRWGTSRRGGRAAQYCSGDSTGRREVEAGRSESRWRLEGWKTAEGNTTHRVQEARIRRHKSRAKSLRVPVGVHECHHLQEPCPSRRRRRAPRWDEGGIEGVRQHTLVRVGGERRPMELTHAGWRARGGRSRSPDVIAGTPHWWWRRRRTGQIDDRRCRRRGC
jgi:hypothetical protein